MKNINNYINEQLSGDSLKPKNKTELLKLIEERISKDGNECDLNDIDTSLITDMSDLFSGSKFNGNISKWNVSNVKDMSYMFSESTFNGEIWEWNIGKVEDMSYMFADSEFDDSISQWNLQKVKYTDMMFLNCPLEFENEKWPKNYHKDN